MINVLLCGANGHMGKVVRELAAGYGNIEIAAGVDINKDNTAGFPIYDDINDVKEKIDVIIDFSHAKAVDDILTWAKKTGTALVECTTGLSDATISYINDCSADTAILRSANMSLGVNTLISLVKAASSVLAASGFDIEIIEKHHNRKLDAPSGTAILLADAINEATSGRYTYVYDRSTKREKRSENEIGIQAIRGGNIVGEHSIIYAGTDEVIEIKHTAYSRAIFAKGAIEAAVFLSSKAPGLYDMQDVLMPAN